MSTTINFVVRYYDESIVFTPGDLFFKAIEEMTRL